MVTNIVSHHVENNSVKSTEDISDTNLVNSVIYPRRLLHATSSSFGGLLWERPIGRTTSASAVLYHSKVQGSPYVGGSKVGDFPNLDSQQRSVGFEVGHSRSHGDTKVYSGSGQETKGDSDKGGGDVVKQAL